MFRYVEIYTNNGMKAFAVMAPFDFFMSVLSTDIKKSR